MAKLQQAQARLTEARANAPRQLVAREAGVSVRQANLELAQAQLRQAQLNLSYAKVLAPVAGIVGKRSVNIGDRVQPGQQLMALTQNGELWVTANFRETQIKRMQPGQPPPFTSTRSIGTTTAMSRASPAQPARGSVCSRRRTLAGTM
jgi:membrane fusion protein (multidrug efflux system)